MKPRSQEESFSRTAIGWMAGIGVASFAAAVLMTAFGQDLTQPRTVGPSAFSDSALGHRAFVRFLEKSGINVILRRDRRRLALGESTPLVVAEPPDADALSDLVERSSEEEGPLVVVLPKWRGRPSLTKPAWVGEAELLPAAQIQEILGAVADPAPGIVRSAGTAVRCKMGDEGQVALELPAPQLLAPSEDLEELVTCPDGVLVGRVDGWKYVVADPDLIANHGLGRAENAVVLHDLLTRELSADAVVLDETVHGFVRQAGLLREMLRFPLVLAVLHALLLLGLALWAGMGRFGKPQPPPARMGAGKEVLIENTAKLLVYGGHTAEGVARYFEQSLRAVAARYFLPPELAPEALKSRLAARARGSRADLARLQLRVRQLGPGVPEAQALALAQEIHRWRREMTDGDRRG